MSQPFLGEIRMFGGNFAPLNWAFCNGQLLPISNYDALFSLIGTTYGGDGQVNFALPNLQSRIPVGQGQGPGLTDRIIGQSFGTETETITPQTMPAHTHPLMATLTDVTSPSVNSNVVPGKPAAHTTPVFYIIPVQGQNPPRPEPLSDNACSMNGGSQPHDNMMPFLVVSYIICLAGIYPSRN